ncbi:MAG: hypothetical protein SO415_05325 [Oliverpabstia sp.]|nr:hypothetical protein [Oliverpabstia sp.]
MMKNITMRETVRGIALDQVVISVVEVTVSRECVLENYIDENNGMITVVGGISLLSTG